MSLVEKLRQARRFNLSIGDYGFIVRRPTDAEAAGLQFASLDDAVRGLTKYVEDWSGVRELDLFSDTEETDLIPFDPEVCAEWLVDRPDLWEGFVSGILNAYDKYREERDAAGKS